jgi:hypothetical protein
MALPLTQFQPVTFDPYAPEPLDTAPDSVLLTPLRVQVTPYRTIKEQYDRASESVADLLRRYPSLFAFTRDQQGVAAGAAATVTGIFAVTQDPRQALESLAPALRRTIADIDGTRRKLDSGDLDPLDLTPIHEQLFKGRVGASGEHWNEPLPRWAAAEAVGDHHFAQALADLGFQAASAALFLLAPFTGGASLYVMVAGLAVSGTKFYLSDQRYQVLGQAEGTAAAPGTELVTRP